MTAKERIRAIYPDAVAIKECGNYVGGKIRYKILLKPGARKPVEYGMREPWAWANACRALGL